MKNEKVLVVDAERCASIPEGFVKSSFDVIWPIVDTGWYMDRREAENDPKYRQVIPYTVITHYGKYYTYRRTPAESESRLTGKVSIGVGGHVNPVDSRFQQYSHRDMLRAAEREIQEETTIEYNKHLDRKLFLLGAVKLSKTPVDKVHLGIVLGAVSANFEIRPKETMEYVGFFDQHCLLKRYGNQLENWSRLIVEKLVG